MPATERVEAAVRRHEDQRGGAKDIADEHPTTAEHEQRDPPIPSQMKQLPQNERDHDAGLERFHPAACFIDAHESIPQLDDVP